MYGKISTVAFVGIDARPVQVEVRITSGQHNFSIVGLPDKAVAESRERVRNALHALGLGLPWTRITVNLAPGDLPKEGSHFDLPIALALLVAMEAISPEAINGYVAIGELALDGALRAVPGALPAAVGANALNKGLICPADCGQEAAWAGENVEIIAPAHLLSLINHFRGTQMLRRPTPNLTQEHTSSQDLRDIKGQETAKRVLEVAAAGGHNLLMIGPPGSGKSMLAQRLPSILPPLETKEMLEVSMVHSLAGELMGGEIKTVRPFRAPHHSASMAALVGGGTRPRPGEVSLAHNGVLFLDELPEFSPPVLDSLRQPLETGETLIARANHRISYPSRIQLIAAMNPCRCGGGMGQSCQRGEKCAADYQGRVSGPLLDRIDLTIEIPAVSAADLCLPPATEGSREARVRVAAARERQRLRMGKTAGVEAVSCTNSQMSAAMLEDIIDIEDDGMAFLKEASEKLGLSARGFHRTMRVALTLADLGGAERICRPHIAEALSYRSERIRHKTAASPKGGTQF